MFSLRIVDESARAPLLAGKSLMVKDWTSVGDVVCARAYVGDGVRWIDWPRVATYQFRSGSNVVEAAPYTGASLARVRDLFRRCILPLVMQANGWEVLHASAVITPRGVLAFCGQRSAGKSTVAFALNRRGYAHFADDMLVMELNGRHVDALALPFAPRLRAPSARFFNHDTGPRTLAESRIAASPREPLAMLFVLQGTSGRAEPPRITRMESGAAFKTLLQHAHRFNPHDVAERKRHFQHFLDITAQVPVYSVRYSYGLDRLDDLLDRVLAVAGVSQPEPEACSA